MLSADVEREALTTEAETATDPERIAEIHTRLVDIEAHNAPARAARILKGLGFDEAAQARSLGEFSGGWRMRVARCPPWRPASTAATAFARRRIVRTFAAPAASSSMG